MPGLRGAVFKYDRYEMKTLKKRGMEVVMKSHLTGLAVLVFFMLAVFQSPAPAQTVLVSPPSSSESDASGRPWLGVTVQDLNPDIIETMGLKTTSGVLVSEVSRSSPAEEAGVVPGDVIITVNGKKVLSSAELVSIIRRSDPGSSVVLELNRSGEPERISVVLGNMPLESTTVYTGTGAGMCAGCQKGAVGGCMDGGASMCAGCSSGMHAPGGGMGGGGCMQGMMQGMQGMQGMMGGHGMAFSKGMPEGEKYGKMYLMAVKGLDLTVDQRKKVRALKNGYIKASITSAADIEVAEVELRELLAADPVNLSRVKEKIKGIEAKKAEMRFFRIKSLEDLKKIFTPEQRKKFGEMTAGEAPGPQCPQSPMTGSGSQDPTER